MYLGTSSSRVMTHVRPQIGRITAPLPPSHHVLEDILSNSLTRKILGWMTRPDADGKCFFMRMCENYDHSRANFWQRLKWSVPNRIIDLGLWKARLEKEMMKQRLFHHPPTVKALALTAKSISIYGLTVPQRFAAPMFPV